MSRYPLRRTMARPSPQVLRARTILRVHDTVLQAGSNWQAVPAAVRLPLLIGARALYAVAREMMP